MPNLLLIEDNLPFRRNQCVAAARPIRDHRRARDRAADGRNGRAHIFDLSGARGDDPPAQASITCSRRANSTRKRSVRTGPRATDRQRAGRAARHSAREQLAMAGRPRPNTPAFAAKTRTISGPTRSSSRISSRRFDFVLTRTNTLTGVRYCDDKAILCWETGNEFLRPPRGRAKSRAYIKSLDTNHLVMDGFNAAALRPSRSTFPDVDIVTTHHYPGQQTNRSPISSAKTREWRRAKNLTSSASLVL